MTPGTTPAVEAADLSVAYGHHPVWAHASFAVRPGEFVAVLGPNGSGKSTLLHLLTGRLRPAHGTIRVFGQPPGVGRERVGFVPQARELDAQMAMRGVDLVRQGVDGHRWGVPVGRPARAAAAAATAAAIEAVDATDFAQRRIGEVSGGQRQRLWLAQALAGDPDLLLLDEPLAGLDVASQATVIRVIDRAVHDRGITALLVAHDVNPLLPVIDKVLFVAGGSVVVGTPEEVMTAETLSALFGSPVDVVRDRYGRLCVVGMEDVAHHAHAGPHDHHGEHPA